MMFRPIHVILGATFTALAIIAPQAQSQTQGHGDVESVVIGGKLTVDEENMMPAAHGTGYKIFKSNFGNVIGGPTGTDDPGFVAPEGTFLSGEQLWYHVLGTLSYWNGTSWESGPSGIILTIEDGAGSKTLVSSTGITNPYGVVDAADAGGGIHAHIDFAISDVNPAGAYLATLELTARDASGNFPSPYLDSDPFHIVFNSGLSSDAFETSVAALMVPEPRTYAMLLAGLVVWL